MSPLTVACVLRTGGAYDWSWVRALYRGVAKHLPDPFRFVCLTDLPEPGNPWCVPLLHDWPGWWSKVEVFRLPGLVLYLDLDTLPVGDLSRFGGYRGRLAVLSGFYRPEIVASGVMLFEGGPHTAAIYDAFRADPERIMREHRPRSDYWYAKVMHAPDRLQTLYPGALVSYKRHARRGIPNGASLVCGHGRPRFDDPATGWAHALWAKRAGAMDAEAA